MTSNKKENMGALVFPEDKELIRKAAKAQRRSMASFITEASIIRANVILSEDSHLERENDTPK